MPKKPKGPKIPKRVIALAERIGDGSLMLTKGQAGPDGGPLYTVMPVGKPCGAYDAIRAAIGLGILKPQEGGLFPGYTQTFVVDRQKLRVGC